MPVLTPSRIAIVVVTLTFFSFLYTFGFPTQLAHPAQPVIDHYDHKNVHSQPIIPAPWIPSPTPTSHATPPAHTHGDRPGEKEDDHRWDDATKAVAQTGLSEPTESSIAEYEKDGGRWEDKDKPKDGDKSGEKQVVSAPTTLLTHADATPVGANATNATITSSASDSVPTFAQGSKFCKDVQGAPHVMIVLRTSKAEIQQKLPTHIKSFLSCVPNFAIFSDHSGSIDGIKVYNALEDISSETKRTHDEFHEYQLMHADSEHIPNPDKTKTLDKWKFLPMVYKAYHLNSDARWFFFMELDTSLSWTNLLQWVNRLDYRIPYYSGSPAFINSVQLAQRGSGILLSQGALRRYAKSFDEKYTEKWEPELGKGCCGDLALAQAFSDAHVEFYSSWPLIQGEDPSSLDYSTKHWCAPAVSWHHTTPDVLTQIWHSQKQWTKEHGWDKPFLYRDAFRAFVQPHIKPVVEKWDNMASDTKITAPQGRQKQLKEEAEKQKKKEEEDDGDNSHDHRDAQANNKPESSPFSDPPHRRSLWPKDENKEELDWDKVAEMFKNAADSPITCQKACEAVDDCLQWRYKASGDGECHLGKVMRLGRKAEQGKDEPWTSGWIMDRIDGKTKEWECKKVNWKFYQ
jgi:hypothetical protein